MKKVLLFLSFALLVSSAWAQREIECNSDLSWEVSDDGVNYNGTPVEVNGGCLDPAIIECICDGTGQTSPSVCTCEGAMEIWGEDWGCFENEEGCNIPCSYRPNTFWFRKVVELDSCEIIRDVFMQVQGDNQLNLTLNGQNVLTTAASQWNQCFDTDTDNDFAINVANVISGLEPGEDLVIEAEVTNVGGGQCMNYAFFSFCSNFTTADIGDQLDADFLLSDDDLGNNTAQVEMEATGNNPPQVTHDWYILSRPAGSQQNFVPFAAVLDGGDIYQFLSSYCIEYRVIHRVSWGDCERCESKTNTTVCDGLKGGEDPDRVSSAEIDCSIIGDYEWPLVKLQQNLPPDQSRRGDLPAGELLIHPNPTQDILHVQWTAENLEILEVVDLSGKVLLQRAVSPDLQSYQLDVSELPAGLYTIIMNGQGTPLTQRFKVAQ